MPAGRNIYRNLVAVSAVRLWFAPSRRFPGQASFARARSQNCRTKPIQRGRGRGGRQARAGLPLGGLGKTRRELVVAARAVDDVAARSHTCRPKPTQRGRSPSGRRARARSRPTQATRWPPRRSASDIANAAPCCRRDLTRHSSHRRRRVRWSARRRPESVTDKLPARRLLPGST